MRKIAIIIGSVGDLSQCGPGLKLLKEAEENIEVVGVFVRSQHRNTPETKKLLEELALIDVDIAIIAAHWANNLTGCSDTFLRYDPKNDGPIIIGVSFSSKSNANHQKKIASPITKIPGTQVAYKGGRFIFVGKRGFAEACGLAINGELPITRTAKPELIADFNLEEAIEISGS